MNGKAVDITVERTLPVHEAQILTLGAPQPATRRGARMNPLSRAFLVFSTLSLFGFSSGLARAEDPLAPVGPAPAAVPPAPGPPSPASPPPNFGPPPPVVPPAKVPGTETWPDFIPLRAAEGRDLSPYGYRPVRRVTRQLVTAGAGIFGVAYVGSITVSGLLVNTGSPAGTGYLLVPVVGPAAWAYTTGGGDGYGEGTPTAIADTVVQVAGIVLLSIGLHRREGWERTPGFLLVPVAGAERAGLAATGRF